jgi:hypothetical protein
MGQLVPDKAKTKEELRTAVAGASKPVAAVLSVELFVQRDGPEECLSQ